MASYNELRGALEAIVRATRAGTILVNGTLMRNADRLIEEARRGITRPTAWTPFERSTPGHLSVKNTQRMADFLGVSPEEATKRIHEAREGEELYVNSRYQVALHREGDHVHLSIKRTDQQPIRTWRDLQRIKNELVGPECECVELYPAESRLVDMANQFHLFGMSDPRWRFPIGFAERAADEEQGGGEAQEPFEAPTSEGAAG